MQPAIQVLTGLNRHNITKTDCTAGSEKRKKCTMAEKTEERKKASWEGPVMGEIVGLFTEPP